MTQLVGPVVRMTGGQCAPDDMGGGWVCRVWEQAAFPHLAIRHNAPSLTTALGELACKPKDVICNIRLF